MQGSFDQYILNYMVCTDCVNVFPLNMKKPEAPTIWCICIVVNIRASI